MGFQQCFEVQNDPDQVIVDFKNSRVCDHSALEAINNLADRYKKTREANYTRAFKC